MSLGHSVLKMLAVATLWPLLTGRRALARLLYENADVVARLAGLDAALRLLRDGGCRHNVTVLKALGATIGTGCMIHSPLLIHSPTPSLERLKIGDGVHVGQDVFIDLTDAVEIESNVTVSMRCALLTHMNVGRSPLGRTRYPSTTRPVRLETGCYLGAAATILAGVRVGARALVGAGAVVIEDVPGASTVGGVPAKPLRSNAPEPGCSLVRTS